MFIVLEVHKNITYHFCLGHVTQGDLVESTNEAEDSTSATDFSPTYFTCEKHFYEEVEDSKDSVWLIQVVPSRGAPLLNDYNWKHVIKKVMPFGIWTGVIHCDLHPRLVKKYCLKATLCSDIG